MSFFYHMYGQTVNSLKIIMIRKGSQDTDVWEKKGDQGNKWIKGQINIQTVQAYQVSESSLICYMISYWSVQHDSGII